MNNRSLWMSAAAALVVASALAGCGSTTYFAGRNLPPSGITNRVMIAIQNPSAFSKGALQIVDAYYDIRSSYTGKTATFSISGFSGALPITIQNMPEEQLGAVYGSGDGSLTLVNYGKEETAGNQTGLVGLSSSIFVTRNQSYTFAANQGAHVFMVLDRISGSQFPLSLPNVYRTSVNPGASVALAFAQDSNYMYYPRKLTAAQTVAFSGGPSTWPKAAVDCQPLNGPGWCLFQAQSPDHVDATGNAYGAPLVFDRPVKAIFSADGGTAYVLNCGPECGGTTASVTPVSIAPMIFLIGQQSGALPATTTTPSTQCGTVNLVAGCIPVPGGASNALLNTSTLYVAGQQPQQVQGQTLFAGNLTVLDLSKTPVAVSNPISISDGAPDAISRMILADDHTMWIGMTKCTNGVRAATGQPFGCLTMLNVANPTSPTVTMLEPYIGDATGIAAVTSLHKIYTAEGGQVYIYSTVDGSSIDNQYVTVTGTAFDVAYIDAPTDGDNTVY